MTQPDFTDLIRNPPTRTKPRWMFYVSGLYAVFMMILGVLQIRAGHGLGWAMIGGGILVFSGYGLDYLLDQRPSSNMSEQDPQNRD